MAKDTVKQHYVPCVLLSRFGVGAGRDALVWVWDKQTGRTWQSKVSAVAFQNDLYTLPQEALDQIEEPDWFPEEYRGALSWESMFKDLEGSFGQVVDLVEDSLTLPPADSDALDLLLRMLVMFEMRTPAHIESMRQQTELFHNMLAEVEMNKHPELCEEGKRPRFVIPFDENKHILFAQSMQHLDEVVRLHRGRNWSLWVSQDTDLVITDYPVSRCFARTPDDPFQNPAPATPNSLFMLPLGRGMLMAGDDRLCAATRLADPRLAAYHNSLCMVNAERFIYTFGDSFQALWWQGSGHAFPTIQDDQSVIVTVDRDEFARLSHSGSLNKPRRWGVHGGGALQELVPPEHRISTEELAREARRNSS